MATVLSLVQDACREIGVNVPSAVVGSADVTAIQMLAIAKSSLTDLARETDWQRLTTQHTFVAFASASVGTYNLPSDWDRFINDTFWDTTNDRPLIGPMTPQEWQTLIRGFLGGAGIDTYFRLIGAHASGGSLHLWPVRTSGSTVLAYDYISRNLAESSSGTAKLTISGDADRVRFDEQLFKMDLIWRFKKAKGLSYADEKLDFTDYLSTCKARNGGARKLNMSGRALTDILSVNIRESDFPSE